MRRKISALEKLSEQDDVVAALISLLVWLVVRLVKKRKSRR